MTTTPLVTGVTPLYSLASLDTATLARHTRGMTKTQTTDCKACTALARVGLQFNHHRRTAPNARTLLRAQIVAHMRDTGCTAAEAEAHFGVKAGPVLS